MIYFDQAASSWPKPPQVAEKMMEFVTDVGANPGRGSHQMALKAARVLMETRANLAKLFNIKRATDIAFQLNTSMALNVAIKGLLKQGDHVITTELEHNSIRRPLEFLKQQKLIDLTYLSASPTGEIDLDQLDLACQHNTKLFACTHSSNLLGNIMPIAEIGEILTEKGIVFLLDGAQTAGGYPVDVEMLQVDLLAFPGHKGLLGPQGTGGLYISPEIELTSLLHGGTGARSESITQPEIRPDQYETGTPNTPGIAGLNEGVKFILQTGIATIQQKEQRLIQYLLQLLSEINEVEYYGPKVGQERMPVVAFNINGYDAAEVAHRLDREFGIAVRAGLHCTPLSHKTANSLDRGAVRASLGYFNEFEEVDYFIDALKKIIK